MWKDILVVFLGLGVGLVSAMFGVGGGILFVPIMILVLGLTQVEATATSLLAVLPTAIVGSWRQHHFGNVRWPAAVVMGVASVGAVIGGAELAHEVPDHILRRVFACLLIYSASQLLWRAWKTRPSALAAKAAADAVAAASAAPPDGGAGPAATPPSAGRGQ
jgi:uncharacterized membrane protein YfcA